MSYENTLKIRQAFDLVHVTRLSTIEMAEKHRGALKPRPDLLYSSGRGDPTMAINALRNKRSGPGGSTRRLHQTFPPAEISKCWQGLFGGEIGSTRVVKTWFAPGMVSAVIGPIR